MRNGNPIWQNVFRADLSTPEGLALWIAPRVLPLLVSLILAYVQFSDIAESVGPEKACSGVVQSLIWAVATHYPTSIYSIFLAIGSLLTFIDLNAVVYVGIISILVLVNVLPQFVLACA